MTSNLTYFIHIANLDFDDLTVAALAPPLASKEIIDLRDDVSVVMSCLYLFEDELQYFPNTCVTN